mgnify:CR=1 FL=1
MAAKIDVITSGYATILQSEQNQGGQPAAPNKYMKASGSCSLVRSNRINVLFDTMGPWERDHLVSSLSELRIHPDDIHFLVCSHSHADHVGNLNLFTRAKKHFVGTSVYTNDVYDLNCFEPIGSYTYKSKERKSEYEVVTYQDYSLDENLTLEPSHGHTMECITMLVSNCEQYGTVALAGDLFERKEDVDDESIWIGAGSQNLDLQRANRSRIYNKVDYILPGHGKLFKSTGSKFF